MASRRYMIAAAHHVTWFLGMRFPRAIPLTFVIGYPKSGTTWVCQLAADYLQIPFPQFALLPIGFEAVVHGHERVRPGYPRGIYVVRDGRDALTSLYFYLTRDLPTTDHPPMARWQRSALPGLVNTTRVAENIGPFVQRQMVKPHSCGANWSDHVRSFFDAANPGVVLLKYEDLLADGERTLGEAMAAVTGQPADGDRVRAALARFSFQRQSSRKPGEEDRSSFLRKGEVGDWANHFTVEAAEIFDRSCGAMLHAVGYEKDSSWLERFRARLAAAGRSSAVHAGAAVPAMRGSSTSPSSSTPPHAPAGAR